MLDRRDMIFFLFFYSSFLIPFFYKIVGLALTNVYARIFLIFWVVNFDAYSLKILF